MRIIRSPQFARSKRLVRFLHFTIEQSLNGITGDLTEYKIARTVYDRPEDFEPLTDGIVRGEVHRLRAKLRDYYRTIGQRDPIVIEYPVGSYAATFRSQDEGMTLGYGIIGGLLQSIDWSHSLGPLPAWPRTLKTCLSVQLRVALPSAVCWGPDLLLFFNEPMLALQGNVALTWLGRSCKTLDSPNWQALSQFIDEVQATNRTIYRERDRLLCMRSNVFEEIYVNTSLSPIPETNFGVAGVLIVMTDITSLALSERRSKTAFALGAIVDRGLYGLNKICEEICRILGENPNDIPFASLYLFDDARTFAKLVGLANIEQGTKVTPQTIPLAIGAGPLSEAVCSGRNVVVDTERLGGSLPPVAEGTGVSFVVLPIRADRKFEHLGVLIAGVRNHRPLDADYRAFSKRSRNALGRVSRHPLGTASAKINPKATRQEMKKVGACMKMTIFAGWSDFRLRKSSGY